MPSWEIHEKYVKLMGIPIEIAKEINKLIDDVRWHDFFNSFLKKNLKPRDPETISYLNYLKSSGVLKFLGIRRVRVVSYSFNSSSFCKSSFYKKIEKYGENGLKAFFLHMFLDLIERNEKGKGFDIMEINDADGYCIRYIWEVEDFIKSNMSAILTDIYRKDKRNGKLKKIKGKLTI
jgi:hypothetical protein